ncbi:hypothetical protein ES703_02624 [subsurface metagenome]
MRNDLIQHPSTVDIIQNWYLDRDTVQRLEKEFQDAIKNTKTTETHVCTRCGHVQSRKWAARKRSICSKCGKQFYWKKKGGNVNG